MVASRNRGFHGLGSLRCRRYRVYIGYIVPSLKPDSVCTAGYGLGSHLVWGANKLDC